MDLSLPARVRLRPPARVRARAGTQGRLRGVLARVSRRRRVLLVLLALVPLLLGGGWLWLRNSSLVSVEHVEVSGATGVQAHQIELALRDAAQSMTTLHVRVGALRAAVASYPVVRDLRVRANFPHGLRIEVIEQPPVAALSVAGTRTAVAADGVVLGPGLLSRSLPQLSGSASDPLAGGGHVKSSTELAELSVLGAVPPTLRGWITRVYEGHEGLTVAIRSGLLLYFGDATRPHAKWLSAARVLADPSSAGAWYIDVRLPQRPAAGLAHGAPGAGSEVTGQVGASDPTAAALASELASAVGTESGSAAVTPTPGTETAPPSAASEESTSTGG